MTSIGHAEASSPDHAGQASTGGTRRSSAAEPVTPPSKALGAKCTVDRSTPSRRRLWLGAGIFLAAVSYILTQGLGNATLYFRTVDEAVAQRGDLGDRRFRIEGDVVVESVVQTSQGVSFTLTSRQVAVQVLHRGDPPELFKPGIPVVLEGSFSGEVFVSDRMLMKHSETYVAQNPQRVAAPR